MIYFDNAATSPLLPNLKTEQIFNPSSPHTLGIQAERELDNARKIISDTIGCEPSNLIFTSGGTESNNLAILGFVMANKRNPITIMAKPWEHPSILQPIKFAEEYFPYVTAHISDSFLSTTGTSLVCTSQVNHETGDMPEIVKPENSVLLIDGCQGFSKHFINFKEADMYTFSGHKCNAPTGVGGLAKKPNIRLAPLLHGGGQEKNLRSGTENLDGIIKLSRALKNTSEEITYIKEEIASLSNLLPNTFINSMEPKTSPYILNMSFLGIKGETLVHALSEKGIYVSMGAACRSRKKVKSALELMGFPLNRAESAIRFSFSVLNTLEEAKTATPIIIETVNRLRRILGGS